MYQGFFGYKYSVVGSLFLLTAGLFLLCNMGMNFSYSGLIVGMILCGGGIGVCDPLFNVLGMNSLPEEYSGEASGVLNTVVYMGELSAIAFGSICFFGFGRYTLSPVVKKVDLFFSQDSFDQVLMGYHETVQLLMTSIPVGVKEFSFEVVRYSGKIGFAAVMLLTAIICLLTTLVAFFWLSRKDYNVEDNSNITKNERLNNER